MAHFHSNALIGAGGGAVEAGYQIDRSLRFNDGDSAHLTRSFQAGNQKKWTWSSWIKRAELGATGRILRANPSGEAGIQFLSNDRLEVYHYQNSSYVVQVVTDRVFRDPSAWFHLVVVYDSDQSTAADRLAIYINGVKETQFNTSTYPSQGYQSYLNGSTSHAIFGSDLFPAGYLAEVHFVDGQALAATDFGKEDSSGVWQPKEYSGTYADKHNGDWVGDTTGSGYNSSHTADKAFDGSTSTSAAATSGGTLTFTPSTAITGITKVRIHAQRDNSASSATITLNGTDISSNWSNGEDKTVEITTNNLTSLAWSTQSNGQWFAVRKIEIYYSGAYYTLLGPSNSFYLKFADNSSNAALGTDSSGNSNTFTVHNLTAGQFSPTATSTGDPTSSTDSPFSSGYSVDFDGNDSLRITGPGTITGDFTAECFIKSSSYGGIQRFFSADQASQSGERLNLRAYQGNTEFYVAPGVSASGTNLPTNQWNHVAITRSGSTVSYYLNGSRWATDTHSAAISVTTFVVAHGFGSEYFTGKVSNARFVDGQALYTGSSYTQPTATLTTTSQGATAANVRLICCHQSSVTAAQGTLTAASHTDSLIDTPTNYTADSGNNGGNYSTMNPLLQLRLATLSNGNLEVTGGSYTDNGWGTIAVPSGKWYAEVKVTAGGGSTNVMVGVKDVGQTGATDFGAVSRGYGYSSSGQKCNSDSLSSYAASYTNGDVIGIALDLDAGTITFYKNGSSQGAAFSGISSSYSYHFCCFCRTTSDKVAWNFGQRSFAYTPPSNHLAVCTTNLPDPTITDGSTAFDVKLYTGNASTQSVSLNLGPDLLWLKSRSAVKLHALCDSVRGDGQLLYANSTLAEQNIGASVVDLTSSGFNLGYNSGYTLVSHNHNSESLVAWAWDAGTSTVSNSDGTITSNVRASQSNGFSIVSYTGNGTAGATVGHGLSAAPEWVVCKDRDDTDNWQIYHASAQTSGAQLLKFTNDAVTPNNGPWNNTAPTNSVVTLGGGGTNDNNNDHIMYCWTPVDQYSAFGSYEGNGSTNGPFVYTGFRPRFILLKNVDNYGTGYDWFIHDTDRDTGNVSDSYIKASTSDSEQTYDMLDILSNGFKIKTTLGSYNLNSHTHVWAAFAEHPFKTARAR